MERNTGIDPLDFSLLDTLELRPAGQGRIFLGRAVAAYPDRPAMLFVHGGFMGAWAFAPYIACFDRIGIPSAAMDCQGHGGLPQEPGLASAGVADYARDVAAAAMTFPTAPVLIGHSLGALIIGVAMGHCRLSGLGLLAPSPPGQMPGAETVPLVPEYRMVNPTPKFATMLQGLAPPEKIVGFTERLCPESPVALNDRYSLRVPSAPPQDIPAFCIAAECDDPQRHPPGQDFAVGNFFGAENHLLKDAVHCFISTLHWAESAAIMTDWYRRHFQHEK